MAADVDIANRALQILGAKRITSLSDDSVSARACLACYEPLRDALLTKRRWVFARARASLAADSEEPDWGKANSFTLPADYLASADPYPEYNTNDKDWEIEGNQLFTNDSAPLYMRYTKKITDVNLMHPLFRELLATEMADQMCEQLTQSNTKKAALAEDKRKLMQEAARANAFEKVAGTPPPDTWLTVRA